MEFPDEVYRDVCSIETLYSRREGFFNDFVNIMLEKTDEEWIKNNFEKDISGLDKIRICCNDPKVWPAIRKVLKNVCKMYREKSEEAGKRAQLEGDSLCEKGDFEKAVSIYSRSIIRAPRWRKENNSDECATLFLAYKGRANALFNLGHYRKCIVDLQMAMKEKCPDHVKHEVFKRMGECYRNISDLDKAGISYGVALRLANEQISRLKTSHSKKKITEADERKMAARRKESEEIKDAIFRLHSQEENEKCEILDEVERNEKALPEVAVGPNLRYPNASKLIKIRRSSEAGRFAAAADRIDVGSTLVVEPPQAAVLIPRMLSSHCCHCFARLFAPIPCDTCSGVAFCSVECRDSATAGYHKYECEFQSFLLGSGISVLSHLCLRMLTQESLSFFKTVHAKMESESPSEFTERESRYVRVHKLVTNSHLRTGSDYFRRVLMAIFLTNCLRKTNYFKPNTEERGDEKKFSQDEILAASVILHHLELLQFNAHEIYETVISETSLTTVHLGVGIYPTAAMFNHECSPSVARYFDGRNIVIKALRPLERDDVLSENYGPHHARKALQDRTRELTSRYWFHCRCPACRQDWPPMANLDDFGIRRKCATPGSDGVSPSGKSAQPNPRETTAVGVKSQIELLFDQTLTRVEAANCDEAIRLLVEFLKKIFELASPPCREIYLAQEALKKYYARTGNVWIWKQ